MLQGRINKLFDEDDVLKLKFNVVSVYFKNIFWFFKFVQLKHFQGELQVLKCHLK